MFDRCDGDPKLWPTSSKWSGTAKDGKTAAETSATSTTLKYNVKESLHGVGTTEVGLLWQSTGD
jgi:hypothetical protein